MPQRSDVWNNVGDLRAEVRTEVQFLADEVRASLAEVASSHRTIEAHAELFRGSPRSPEVQCGGLILVMTIGAWIFVMGAVN